MHLSNSLIGVRMTENQEGVSGSGLLVSMFWRVFLILGAALMIFAGPTYVPYVLNDALKLNYIASIVIGFALFIVGIFTMIYLIRKKVIT
jgi:uncharacterized membrane protein HdeD (DUF308 family)